MKVLFVSSGNKNYDISPLVKSQGDSIKHNNIDLDYFIIKGNYFPNIINLRNRIITHNYDLIHAHYSYSALLVLLSLTCKPLVVSFMGSDIQIKNKLSSKFIINSVIRIAVELFSKKIIVKSEKLKKILLFKNKSIVIPNGVDFKKYKPKDKNQSKRKLKLNPDFKYILFLGNKNNKNKNYQLVKSSFELIGRKNIRLLNYNYPIDPLNVPKYINAADVVVLSSFLEGSPNIVKESMACNTPVVSVDVGDVKNIIKKTKGCYLSSYDPNDFSKNILNAIDYGKPTDGRYNINYLELNKIAIKVIDLYKTILK